MSKKGVPIKEKIFQHALMRFNDSGIEQVGMRELATELDMHVGNLTYYFATKNDLLNEIARRLGEANAQLLESAEREGIDGFLDDMKDIFINQWTYRCVVVSLVNILRQNPEAAARYVQTQAERRNGIRARIRDLRTAGFLDPNLSDTTIANVSESISMIGRFWVNDKLTSHPEWDLDKSLQHYIRLIEHNLSQYATPSHQG